MPTTPTAPLRIDPLRLAALETSALKRITPIDDTLLRTNILDLCADLRVLRGLPPRDEKQTPLAPRPLVAAFATAMEERMRANDNKGPDGLWNLDPILDLLNHLQSEVNELRDTCLSPYHIPVQLRREAADVGNMAAMCADRMSALHLRT